METRTSGPTAGQDTVTYTGYDDVHDKVFSGLPCTVAALSSSNGRLVTGDYYAPVLNGAGTGTSAYVDPTSSASGNCYNVTGTTTYNDGTGRVVATDDPLGTGTGSNGTGCLVGGAHHTTCTSYAAVVASSVAGLPSSDGEPYLQVVTIDANLHQSAVYKDAFGRTAYTQELSGASQTALGSGITSYAVTSEQYDPMGKVRTITDAQGNVTRYTYDATGRETGLVDPDRGTWAYTYDANGNQTEAQDTQDTAYTTFAGYDGLNRTLWQSAQSNGSAPFATWSYDSTAGGNDGVGRLTGETFASGPGQAVTGSYSSTYDARGELTATSMQLSGPSTPLTTYTTSASYDDAGLPATLTYPDGEQLSYDYDPRAGLLQDVQSTLPGSGQGSTFLVSSVAYAASGQLSSLGVEGAPASPLYTERFSYDNDLRLTEQQATLTSSGSVLYDEQLGYDAASNVTSVQTTLPAFGSNAGGTEQQSFCYDEQNRLVWAGTHGTPSAGTAGAAGSCGPTPAADTLPGGSYQYSLGYDTLDRFTTGPLGSASYADPAHLHAVTSEGTSYYSAAYDAAGNMVCRAENNSSGSCANGSNTGAQLGWDSAGRLLSWQNTPTNPSSTDAFAYDGEGQRVWQQSGSGSSTSTTVYVGATLADYTYSGTAGTSTGHTNRYVLPGGIGLLGVRGGSATHLLLTDHLGTPVVQLDAASGAVQNELLTQPYGRYRYAATTLYTEAFTGQRRDTTPDVMYFNARYYDQQSGAFLSADTDDAGGLNRYAYVGGNPESATDPSGHAQCYECVGAAAGGDWFNSGGVGPNTTVLYDLAEYTLGLVSMYHDVKTILNPDADLATKLGAFGDVLVQGGLDALMLTGEGEEVRGAELSGRTADELTRAAVKASEWTDDAAKAGLVADDGLNVPGRVAEEDAAKAAAEAGDDGSHLHGGSGTPGDEGPSYSSGGPGGPSGPVNTNPTDLYRGGNASGPITSSTPRPGIDVFPDASGNIRPTDTTPLGRPAGISTFESPRGSRGWWKLPAGTKLPSGLALVNDDPATGHWTILPAREMSVDTYRQFLLQIQGWVKIW